MPESELLAFIISACLGALIGLERQWEEQREGESLKEKAGLRTFVLWALLGTTSAYVGDKFVPGFYPFGFSAMALLLLSCTLALRGKEPLLGLTTLSSALLTFFIGSLVFWGQTKLSVILTVSTLLLLAGKRPIHRWSKHFTEQDVRSALQFLAITGVVLPLAPHEDYGPFGAFNPFKIWLMVVLVTGLGFFGYVAMRLFGANAGLGTMGILGGLTSSTVTTVAFSRQSREKPELSAAFALAVVLACTIMLVRVGVLTATVNWSVFLKLWPALVLMCVPGVGYAVWFLVRGKRRMPSGKAPQIANPLSLKIALQFAALYALVVFLARAGANYFGSAGITVVSFLSGLTDMDAIALSLSQMAAAGQAMPQEAAGGVIVGALSNTLVKSIFALSYGAPELRVPATVVFGATILCGLAGWWML